MDEAAGTPNMWSRYQRHHYYSQVLSLRAGARTQQQCPNQPLTTWMTLRVGGDSWKHDEPLHLDIGGLGE